MARESVKILQGKLDVESLISQLNAALAEEWLAYYQYWVGALVVPFFNIGSRPMQPCRHVALFPLPLH